MKTLLKTYAIIFLLGLTIACKQQVDESSQNDVGVNTTSEPAPAITKQSDDESRLNDESYHTDDSYKYEYRTGTNGSYTYNYNVSGTDDDGNDVSGNVSMSGEDGSGTLTNDEGEDIDVEVKWIGYGKLEAIDNEGRSYDLGVD